MDVKEKLVELLNEVQETGVNEIPAGFGCTRQYITNERVAAHLISHGVTVHDLDGCEFCNDHNGIGSRDEDIYISGNILRIDIGCYAYSQVEIKFCPMCGRRLPKPPKEDCK